MEQGTVSIWKNGRSRVPRGAAQSSLSLPPAFPRILFKVQRRPPPLPDGIIIYAYVSQGTANIPDRLGYLIHDKFDWKVIHSR